MDNRRVYSDSFKQQVVEEIVTHRATAGQMSRRYGLSPGTLYNWINMYRGGHLQAKVLKAEEDPALLRGRIEALERLLGKLALENDLLKKVNLLLNSVRPEGSSLLSADSTSEALPDPAELLDLPVAPTTTEPERLPPRNLRAKPILETRSKGSRSGSRSTAIAASRRSSARKGGK